jgi:AraC-like DNA-binding protein
MAANPWDSVDPLARILHSLRTDGTFYCRSELSAPWGLQMPTMDGCVWFHAVTSGHCTLQTDDVGAVEVSTGDFVLVPHGRGHTLCSDAEAPAALVTELPQEMVSDRYSLLAYGEGGPQTTLVCGVIRLETPFVSDLGSLLPPLIHLNASSSMQTEWVSGTLRLLAVEAKGLRPGGETVLTRLADILVVQSIRAWLESNAQQQTGLLAAVNDAQIGRVLMQVHEDPSDAWSVESLAASAGMSRSGFCARFRQLMDTTPMQYVTHLRMRAVQRTLQAGKASVGELAEQYGYNSEAAFNRAFKRCVGVSPGAVKRAAKQ